MPDLHYYYIVELSFYWSLMFSQFIDIKRKVRTSRLKILKALNTYLDLRNICIICAVELADSCH